MTKTESKCYRHKNGGIVRIERVAFANGPVGYCGGVSIFLHRPGCRAKDTPDGMVSPCGLYGENILVLQSCVDHECPPNRFCPSGMVYWQESSLRKLSQGFECTK